MSKEAALKSSLSVFFLIFLNINTAGVALAAKSALNGTPWSLVGEDTSMGLRWLILAIVAAGVIGADRVIHGMFLEGGVSPVDTTWSDFMLMAYLFLTTLAVFFMSEESWIAFGFFLVLLFLFTIVILKRLLDDTRRWLIWVVAAIILACLTGFITTTVFSS